jgi:hypothetical protein
MVQTHKRIQQAAVAAGYNPAELDFNRLEVVVHPGTEATGMDDTSICILNDDDGAVYEELTAIGITYHITQNPKI